MNRIGCQEFEELVALHPLEVLSPAERVAVRRHADECGVCRQLLADFEAVGSALLVAAPPVAAPSHLEADLRRRLERETAGARPAAAGAAADAAPGWWTRFFAAPPRWALAGGMAALALLVASNTYLLTRSAAVSPDVGLALQFLHEGGQQIALEAADAIKGARGSYVYDAERKDGVLLMTQLPAPPAGKAYQLWMIDPNGQRESGGVFRPDREGTARLIVNVSMPMCDYRKVGVTIEPAAGSPQPTGPKVLGGDLVIPEDELREHEAGHGAAAPGATPAPAP